MSTAPSSSSSSSVPAWRKRSWKAKEKENKKHQQQDKAIPTYEQELEMAHQRMRMQEGVLATVPPLLAPFSTEHMSGTLYFADRGERLMTGIIEAASLYAVLGSSPTEAVPTLTYENYKDILVAMQWFPKQYEDKFVIFLGYLMPAQVCTMYKLGQVLRSTEAASLIRTHRIECLSQANMSATPTLTPPVPKTVVMDFDGTLGIWVSSGQAYDQSLQPLWPETQVLDSQGRPKFFLIRPGWQEFADEMIKMGVGICAMTATQKTTAEAVRAILQWKLQRDVFKEVYVLDEFRPGVVATKDLRRLFTEEQVLNTVLVDDYAADLAVPKECAFPVATWWGDAKDKQLFEVLAFFKRNMPKVRNMQELAAAWCKEHPDLCQPKLAGRSST